jgi:DnaK suppressor protein
VAARIGELTSQFDSIVAESLDANADDEHDPEGSTIAYEKAQVASFITGARANLHELDQALIRLAAGCYSVCEGCGRQIAPERLAALPAVRTCIECALAGVGRRSVTAARPNSAPPTASTIGPGRPQQGTPAPSLCCRADGRPK